MLAGFAYLDRPAKSLFGGDQDRPRDWVALDRQLNPFATTADDDGSRISGGPRPACCIGAGPASRPRLLRRSRVYQEPGKRGYASESVELTSHLQISFELDIGQTTGGDGLGSYKAFKPMASNLISNIACSGLGSIRVYDTPPYALARKRTLADVSRPLHLLVKIF
jgi:hypothetical protein